ncbi:MAG TPA: hypothetical protein VGG74_09585 [Kofleriaceae bacterium]|jgi:hypothetical protein
MIIVFGRRSFGRVDAHGGEHAQTTFGHVYYMPILPVSSFWVTQQLDGAARGFTIRTSGKSIAAAYLRCWGPVAAFGALVAGGAVGFVIAALLASASAWAWTWRSLRGELTLRQSDFQMLAFGTRCDPERMPAEMREKLKHGLDERWAALDAKRSPDEVAEHGAASTREAVIAYGLLRLASIDAPRGARAKAAQAAQRIVEGAHEAMPAGDGPYRAVEPTETPIFGDVANAATAMSAANATLAANASNAARMARRVGKWWHPTRAKVFLAVFVTLACIGGLSQEGPALCGARELSSIDAHVSSNELVSLQCAGDVENIGQFEHGERVYGCIVGNVIVPVVGDVDGSVAIGTVHSMTSGVYQWPSDILTSPQFASSYLKVESLAAHRAIAIALIAGLAALFGIVVVWLRFVVRRRRRSQR